MVIMKMFTQGEAAHQAYDTLCAAQLRFFSALAPSANVLPYKLVLSAYDQKRALALAILDHARMHAEEFWWFLFRGSTRFDVSLDMLVVANAALRRQAAVVEGRGVVGALLFPATHHVQYSPLRYGHQNCHCFNLRSNFFGVGTIVDEDCFCLIVKRAITAMTHALIHMRLASFDHRKDRAMALARLHPPTDRSIAPLLVCTKRLDNPSSPDIPWMLYFMHLKDLLPSHDTNAPTQPISATTCTPRVRSAPSPTWRNWMTGIPRAAATIAARFLMPCIRPRTAIPRRAEITVEPYQVATHAHAPAQQLPIGHAIHYADDDVEPDIPALEPGGDDEDLATEILIRETEINEAVLRRCSAGASTPSTGY
jgi:hypothetical protein